MRDHRSACVCVSVCVVVYHTICVLIVLLQRVSGLLILCSNTNLKYLQDISRAVGYEL